MDAGTAATLIGGDFTAGSIVIVFHMFTMQRWLDQCQQVLGESISCSVSSGAGSFARADALRRVGETRRSFPVLQVVSLGFALTAMCSLAFVAGWSARDTIPVFHTCGPALLLLGLYCATLISYRRAGMRVIDEAEDYLGSTTGMAGGN